jgi:NTE family protein
MSPSKQRKSVDPAPERKTIDLALQGGGAHGALTWGVLDRLLAWTRASTSPASAAPAPGP